MRSRTLFSLVREAVAGARFVREAAGVLRSPLSLAQARAALEQRQRHRADAFLAMMREAVYGWPASPYAALLRSAGIAYGDLERLVRQVGLDGALATLLRAGVYLDVDELKGRRPVRRGSTVLHLPPDALLNPLVRAAAPARTAGSGGAPTQAPVAPALARALGGSHALIYAAQGSAAWAKAIWYVPGGAALLILLNMSAADRVPERWFTQIPPDAPGLHPRYRYSAHAIRLAGALAGRPLPAPIHAPPTQPAAVAHWLAATLRTGRTPFLKTNVSAALHTVRWAAEHGLDLRGARLSVGGEPLTATRLAALQASGATVTPYYGAIESNLVGEGCVAPSHADEVHVLDDVHALTAPGDAATDRPGLYPDSLLFTSLHPAAALVLLNASLGDVGVLERRDCGCPLAALGWGLHLHTIRNPQKLTAAGMTFLDADLARVLDKVLPDRFGGGPMDYQLVEEEGPDGQACLRLLVGPRVPGGEPAAIKAAFLEAIGGGSGVERVMGTIWRAADLLTVERGEPRSGATGKVLHLHQAQRATVGP